LGREEKRIASVVIAKLDGEEDEGEDQNYRGQGLSVKKSRFNFQKKKRKKKRKEKKKETFISGHCLNGLGQPFHALTLISKKGLEPPVTLVGLNCFWFSFQKSEKEGDWGRGTNTPRPIRKCALTGGQGEGEGGPEGLNFYFCLKSMTPGSSKNPQY